MFAAYSKNDEIINSSEKVSSSDDWLKNASFSLPSKSDCFQINDSHQPSSSPSPTHKIRTDKKLKNHSSKKKSHKHKKKKAVENSNVDEESLPLPKETIFSGGLNLKLDQSFYQDKKGEKNNLAFPNLYNKNVARLSC